MKFWILVFFSFSVFFLGFGFFISRGAVSKKKIPPQKKWFFRDFWASFLDDDSVSSEYHGVCVASVRVCEGCLGKNDRRLAKMGVEAALLI